MTSAVTFFMVKEFAMWALLGGLAAALWVVPLIDLLYKWQFTSNHVAMPSKVNEEWMKIHGTSGTPSLGGVLVWLTVPAILLLGFWAVPFMRALAFIILLIGLYGFIDGVLDVVTKKNLAFREFQNTFEWRVGKLLVSLALNVGVAMLIIDVAGVKAVSLLGYVIHLDTLVGILGVAFVSSIFGYATEIIDGIDGLSSGMYMITLVGLALLMLAYPANFLTSISSTTLAAVGIMEGVLMVYLYFNIPPARFYMGAPGAMPMGAVFLLFGLYGNMVPALIVLMIPYVFDLATSTIQIIAIRFFKRKVFKIAPIHHHFEAMGWPGTKVVMRFWLFNFGAVLLAILAQLLFS